MKKLVSLILTVIFTLCLLSVGMSEEINVTPAPTEENNDVTNEASEVEFTFLSLDDLLATLATEEPAPEAEPAEEPVAEPAEQPETAEPEQSTAPEEKTEEETPEAPVEPAEEEAPTPESEPVEPVTVTPEAEEAIPAEEAPEVPVEAEPAHADETEAAPASEEALIQEAQTTDETVPQEVIPEEAEPEESIPEETIPEVQPEAKEPVAEEAKSEEPEAEEPEAEEPAEAEAEEEKPVEIRNGIVLSGDHEGKVVVYQLPDANSPILTYLAKGDTIQVAEILPEIRMARICLDGDSLYGYIFSDHIALFNATAEEQQVVRSITITDNIDHTQPIREGTVIRLSVSLTGFEDTNYTIQWQYSPDNGVTVYDIPGANDMSYAYRVNEENVNNIFRVIVNYDD